MAVLQDELSEESFNIFGIFADDVKNIDLAEEYKKNAGLDITDILVSESMLPAIENISYVPYLYFVDSTGDAIKLDKVGTQTAEQLKDLVNEAFEMIE
ncbi:MAG: hypothetical protein ACLFPS_08485 [Clostridia bacterium]